MREARDRFNAGVATTVEVVQAQEQVASAESDYISGLFAFDLARISLSRAMGEAEADLPNLLSGVQSMSTTTMSTTTNAPPARRLAYQLCGQEAGTAGHPRPRPRVPHLLS